MAVGGTASHATACTVARLSMKRIAGPVVIFACYLALVGAASALNRYSLVAEYADTAIVAVHFAMLLLCPSMSFGIAAATSTPVRLRCIIEYAAG